MRLPDRLAPGDRPLGDADGAVGIVGGEHPGLADQRRHERLDVAAPLGQLDGLAVQRQRLAALAAQRLDVAELAQRVVDEVGPEPLPDPLGPAEVAQRVVEPAHLHVGVAAVGVGERAERLRADQLGDLDRRAELGERLVVGALLGVVAAAVGADAHDLDDVAGPLGVDQRLLVRLGVGPAVAAQRGEHRLGRVHGRQRGVVAGRLGGRRGRRRGAARSRRRRPGSSASPPARPAPATPRPGRCRRCGRRSQAASASSSRPRRYRMTACLRTRRGRCGSPSAAARA